MNTSRHLSAFLLAPDICHLNHGSYGAVPRIVHEKHCALLRQMEERCSSWFRDTYPVLMADARRSAASFLGGLERDWVFAESATQACNAILLSQKLSAGDEVIFLSEIYGAVHKALRHWCESRGVILVEVPVALPVEGPEQVVDGLRAALTGRTKLAVFDHIASPSAIRMPVEEMSRICRDNGTRVLIDGAHVPGQLPLDVEAIGVDYYVGNAHKWLFAPKGCAVLWARSDRQADLHPGSISHGYGEGWQVEFDWVGTRDATPWFCLPDAIGAWERFGGLDLVARNKALARDAGEMLAHELRAELSCPADMAYAMATLRLPGVTGDVNAIKRELGRRYPTCVCEILYEAT
ncbi:aminotransferase class V-fold PLP-dependent enzyme [Ruegeria sp.]|uniref:aminotransferase class V-fold PLP-dependent enzyme n=1 Tax=Ruegeria sp. TaxID=1879320 RepID=UPI003C7E2BB2